MFAWNCVILVDVAQAKTPTRTRIRSIVQSWQLLQQRVGMICILMRGQRKGTGADREIKLGSLRDVANRTFMAWANSIAKANLAHREGEYLFSP